MALKVRKEKQPIALWRWIVSLILLVCAAVLGWYLYQWYMKGEPLPVSIPAFATADPRVDETEVTEQQVSEHRVPDSHPRYISIPSLGVVNTRVFAGGVDDNNILESPMNISDASWYDKSATPGSGGAVLINAHNGGITRNGVFSQLGTLQKGDVIEVERGDGKKFRYEVRENESMALDEVNTTGMKTMMESVEPGKEALNLITCDGRWVPRYQQFDRRIMLRAVLVE